MVTRLGMGLLGMAMLCSTTQGAPRLELRAETTDTELGNPIGVQLIGTNIETNLLTIDLDPLREDFGVVVVESTQGTSEQGQQRHQIQRLRLDLYPRHTGTSTVPALHMGTLASTPVPITVRQARAGSAPIEVRAQLAAHEVWARQQVIYEVEVVTAERFAVVEAANAELPGFEVIALPPTRIDEDSDGARQTRWRLGWALFPLSAGEYLLTLPAIDYRLRGRTGRSFHLPRKVLRVRPLPPYIPPLMPVGRVAIDSVVLPAAPRLTGALSRWQITLRGPRVPAHWLPAVLRQIKSTPDIAFLPSQSTRTHGPNRSGVNGRVHHEIPFKPLTTGRASLPDVSIQYFDPDTGRIVAATHRANAPYAISPSVAALAGLVFILGIYFVARPTIRWVRRGWTRRRQRSAALAALQRAPDPLALRRALGQLALAEGWPANLSLSAWTDRWCGRFETRAELPELVQQLSLACYSGRQVAEFTGLRQQLLECLSRRRRPRPWRHATR